MISQFTSWKTLIGSDLLPFPDICSLWAGQGTIMSGIDLYISLRDCMSQSNACTGGDDLN